MAMRLALKLAILAADKSQRQFAAECGIHENRLSEIVRGWTDPRPAERKAIAAALGQPPEALFGWSSEEGDA